MSKRYVVLECVYRTTAMSHQAEQTFVLLFFVPDILNKDLQMMKQIVERQELSNGGASSNILQIVF